MGEPDPLLLGRDDLALVTDLYELTMLAAYLRHRPGVNGCFELYVRSLPRARAFLIAAGLAPALAALEQMRFDPVTVAALRRQPALAGAGDDFFTALEGFRFACDVWAVAEGTVVFAGEPIVRVEGPIWQAQLVETYLLAAIGFETMVASKAARIRIAAGRRTAVDFGSRRAHGPQAACWAARAAFIGGLDGTSNVWAAQRFGIPAAGTMAHSFVLAFEHELDAFRAYSASFPESSVLLVDTFDPIAAVERAASEPELRFVGIRLDSGDLPELAREARVALDAAGRSDVRILVSGDLDETVIAEILAAGAPVDGFGVGTRLVTSEDAPFLNAVYKLVEVVEADGRVRPVAKRSAGKSTQPGAKQVWRRSDRSATFVEDMIVRREARPPRGLWEPLLEPWMVGGRLVRAVPGVADARDRTLAQLDRLPGELRRRSGRARFRVLRAG